MEVGPLARVLALYASGHAETKELAGQAIARLSEVSGRSLPFPDVLFTTLGRTAARCLETVVIAHAMRSTYQSLVDLIKAGDTSTFNGEKWEPYTWRLHGSAARRARALDRDRWREDRELPNGRSHHVECLPA
jgi:hydrogenase large subunit